MILDATMKIGAMFGAGDCELVTSCYFRDGKIQIQCRFRSVMEPHSTDKDYWALAVSCG